ncbi:hypothetical protein HK104_008446 [Borealophlyctis nickersoniae]|nr:hypothetical protein HK104_008446 [Borealophlyctis nickersoniae]
MPAAESQLVLRGSQDDNDQENQENLEVVLHNNNQVGDPNAPPRDAVSSVIHGLGFIVGVANIVTKVGFKAAKHGTRRGIGFAKDIVNGVGEATGLEAVGLTPLISGGLSIAEFFAIAGIEVGKFWTDFGLGAAGGSIQALDNVFGSTDTALAIRGFTALVGRELQRREADGARSLADIGTLNTVRGIIAWVALQSLTNEDCLRTARTGGTRLLIEGTGPSVAEPDEAVEWTGEEGDLVQGIITQSTQSTSTELADEAAAEYEDMSPEQQRTKLHHELRRYMKFASGAYGKHAISVFSGKGIPLDYFWSSTSPRDGAHNFFSTHAEIPLESIFHSNHMLRTDWFSSDRGKYRPGFFVLIDRPARQVVISFRGTLSFDDLMLDLTCDYTDHLIADGQSYAVHSGMMKVARTVSRPGSPSKLFETVRSALEQHRGYGLLLTGHSLGAGIATLLTLLWGDFEAGKIRPDVGLPAGRRLHCYAFAAPCVTALPLSRLAHRIVTSVVVGTDVISRLSLGSVRDLTNVVAQLNEKDPQIRDGLVASMGLTGRAPGPRDPVEDAELRRHMQEICIRNDKLYPTGRVLWVHRVNDQGEEADNPDEGTKWQVGEVEDLERVLGQIVFTRTMIRDHMPPAYWEALQHL